MWTREVLQVTGHQMDLLYTSSILRAGCSADIPREEGRLCHLQRFVSTAHVSTAHYTCCMLGIELYTMDPRCSKTQLPGANSPLSSQSQVCHTAQCLAAQKVAWDTLLPPKQTGYRGSVFGSDPGLLARNPTLAAKFSLRKVARGE